MKFTWLKSRTTLYVLGIAAIVAMAAWSPAGPLGNPAGPVSIGEVARQNKKLPDGTLRVPRTGIVLDDGTLLASVAAIGRRGDVLIRDRRQEYQLVWLRQENRYLIDIQGEDYETLKAKGEQEYLDVVGGGSFAEACKRNVIVTVAPWLPPRPTEVPNICIP